MLRYFILTIRASPKKRKGKGFKSLKQAAYVTEHAILTNSQGLYFDVCED